MIDRMPTPARRYLQVLALLPLALSGCFLVPTVSVECSEGRPCRTGQSCDPDTSTCREDPSDMKREEEEPGPKDCQGDCPSCDSHAICASQVCDLYKVTPMGGSCVPISDVVYVNNLDGTCVPGGGADGDSPQTALCTLAEGLARAATAGKRTIRVAASTVDYGPVVLSGRAVSLFGPGGEGGRARLGGTAGTDAVSVSSGANVVLDGFDIIGKAEAGVSCAGGDSDTRLWLRRMRITDVTRLGIVSSSCRLEIDRSLLLRNGGGALHITGAREYYVTNSVFAKHVPTGQPALKLGGSAADYSFRFNTVAENNPRFAATIDCSTKTIKIENSIVVSNGKGGGQSQFQSGCYVVGTVVGPSDSISVAKPQQRQQPTFMSVNGVDYGLKAEDAMTRTCCIDQTEDKILTDFFGTRRPMGGKSDIGVYEAR
jgi:hypothetical protein